MAIELQVPNCSLTLVTQRLTPKMHDGVLGAADIQFSASSIGVDVGSAARLGPLPAEARIPEQRSPVVQQNMYINVVKSHRFLKRG